MDKTPRTDAVWRDIAGRITSQQYLDACKIELELSAANAQLAEYKRDAERYRWLRDQYTVPYGLDWQGHIQNIIVFWDDGTGLDAAIDAAMDQTEQKR